MAIAGTIELDEHFGDLRDDAHWEFDEAEVDNLIDWWKSLGLGGYGRMENEEDVRDKDGPIKIPAPIPVPTVSKSSQELRNPSRNNVNLDDASCPQKCKQNVTKTRIIFNMLQQRARNLHSVFSCILQTCKTI